MQRLLKNIIDRNSETKITLWEGGKVRYCDDFQEVMLKAIKLRKEYYVDAEEVVEGDTQTRNARVKHYVRGDDQKFFEGK